MSAPLTTCIREDIGQATVTGGLATVYAFLLVKPAQAGRAGVAALLSPGAWFPLLWFISWPLVPAPAPTAATAFQPVLSGVMQT